MDQRRQPQRKKWRGSTKTCLEQLNKSPRGGGVLLVMGDFNAKVGRRETSVGLMSNE